MVIANIDLVTWKRYRRYSFL